MHTPGPWAIAAEIYIVANPSHDGRVIGNVDRHEFLPEMRMANARLIAAAPDMLAALQAAETELSRLWLGLTDNNGSFEIQTLVDTQNMIYAAILKAKGNRDDV